MTTERRPGPQPVPATESDSGPRTPADEFARAILCRLAAKWARHDEAARTSDDPRHVHAMRVAAQRARSALRAYAGVLPGDPLGLRAALGPLRRALGPVRDLDVQLARVEAHRARALTGPETLDGLAAALATRRRAAWQHAAIALDLPNARAVVRDFVGAGTTELDRVRDVPTAGALAPSLVRRARRRARAALRRFERRRDVEASHALRRRCRELRYVLEFQEPLWGAPARGMIRRIVRLQDGLGAVQDAAVARAWIERLLVEDGGRLSRPAVFEAGRLHERARRREATGDASALAEAARRVLRRRAWRDIKRVAARAAAR